MNKQCQPSTSTKLRPQLPTCWICLDELDDSGNPALRDCSCRGNDAGFAHLSCIVKYAEQKSLKRHYSTISEFEAPWIQCPNCNQLYRNQLALDLVNASIDYLESKYPLKDWRHLTAYQLKLGKLSENNRSREEVEDVALKCTSLLDQLLRTTPESSLEPIVTLGGSIYGVIATLELENENMTKNSAKRGIEYLQKSIDMYEKAGFEEGVVNGKACMSFYQKICVQKFGSPQDFGRPETPEEVVERHKYAYKLSVNKSGEVQALNQGRGYAIALMEAFHAIEAIQLLQKLISISHQFHGQSHATSKSLESLMTEFKTYTVMAETNQEVNRFQALRYEGDMITIQGPIQDPRVESEENTFSVEACSVLFDLATPVVCHGLKNATHLNGKAGDLRSFDKRTKRYGVHFEDRNFQPKLIKPENLRILFDLPENCTE